MKEIIEELIKIIHETKGTKTSCFLLFIAFSIIICTYFITQGINMLTIICAAGVVLAWIVYFVYTCKHNTLPKCNKSKTGILVLIDAKDKDEYEDTNRKFLYNLENKINNDDIRLILVPIHLNNTITKDNYKTKLKKANASLLVKLHIDSETLKDEKLYSMSFNYKNYFETINELVENITKDFVRKEIKFKDSQKMDTLLCSSNEISYMLELAIGLTHLNNKDIDKTIKSFDCLNKKIDENNDNNLNLVKINHICKYSSYIMHMIKSNTYYNKYIETKNPEELNNMDNEMELANEYMSNMTEYCCDKAIVLFLRDRDIFGALSYLNIINCRYYPKNVSVHKYSIAFINAYRFDISEISIVNLYRSAFKSNDLLRVKNEVIYFIENLVPENEKNNNKLYFALALLYKEIGIDEKFIENMNKYFEVKGEKSLNPTAITIIDNRYGIDLKEIFKI